MLAVLVLHAAEAAAGTGYGQLIVNPGTVSAGQTVSILGVCPTNGTPFTGVYSSAFVGGEAAISRGSVNFTGSATVSSSVSPGTYTVAARCGTGSPSVKITVAAPSSAPTTAPAASQPSVPTGQGPSTYLVPTIAAPTSQTSTAAAGASASTGAAVGGQSPPALAMDGGPVSSPGIVSVGLTGNSKPLLSATAVVSLIAVVTAAGAAVFLGLYRRRKSNTHNS